MTAIPAIGDIATIRHPQVSDAESMYEIATRSSLDNNSRYLYTLWCTEFSDTTAVAEAMGSVAGFVTCFAKPTDPDCIFIWQAGIDPDCRGVGLAGRMLDFVHAGRFSRVECTVSPNNGASYRFLEKFANAKSASISVRPYLSSADLGGDHEPEHLVSIGPIHKRD